MSTSDAGIRRGALIGMLVIGVLLAGMLGWVLGVRSSTRATALVGDATAADATTGDFGPAPEYTGLTNQLGQTIGSARFRGKLQVVTLLFPYCTTDCPLVAAHLAGFAQVLESAGLQDRVAIVTFNIDPDGAGPAQMRDFLRQYGWDPSDTRWQYLTGDPAEIRRVVSDGFHLFYRRVANDSTGAAPAAGVMPQPEVVNALATRDHVGYDVEHSDVLVLVGPDGRIRRIDSGAELVSPSELLRQVRAMLKPTGA